MDTLLIAVTVLSLAIAAAMSLVVLKLLREDRRRSEARIAALLEAAAPPHAAVGSRPPLYGATHTGVTERSRVRDREAPHKGAPYRSAGEAPRKEAPSRGVSEAPRKGAPHRAADLPLRAGRTSAELFVEPQRRPSWGPRIALVAGIVAVLIAVSFTMLGPGAGPATTAPAALAEAGSAPLELLTLRHMAGAGSLTVSGLVQNPRSGAALRRVTAVVYALDASGQIVATTRAPIDLTTFGPGEESPFVVTVPVRGAVARYRVGFRTEGGEVIAHVDRRAGADALAHK